MFANSHANFGRRRPRRIVDSCGQRVFYRLGRTGLHCERKHRGRTTVFKTTLTRAGAGVILSTMKQKDVANAPDQLSVEAQIRKRAHEIWLAHDEEQDSDTSLEDWLQAEREVLGAGKQRAAGGGSAA